MGGFGQNSTMPRDSGGPGSKSPSGVGVEGRMEGRNRTETEVVDNCVGLGCKGSRRGVGSAEVSRTKRTRVDNPCLAFVCLCAGGNEKSIGTERG